MRRAVRESDKEAVDDTVGGRGRSGNAGQGRRRGEACAQCGAEMVVLEGVRVRIRERR